MRRLKRLYETILRETDEFMGKDLLVVDIQPEYSNGFDYWLPDFIEFINENYRNFNSITFYYNGAETVGELDENGYKYWLSENELDEDVLYYAKFYDKGYAFFRFCMDEGIDDENVSNLVRHMMDNNINDSREMDDDFWNEFMTKYGVGGQETRELVEFSDDCISIPDLMDDLKTYNNILVCGGGENECLKEVYIALDALEKPYQTLNRYVY